MVISIIGMGDWDLVSSGMAEPGTRSQDSRRERSKVSPFFGFREALKPYICKKRRRKKK
ncbi:predicted protein [Sclerotinia sclerotiorum 1980 UF-70]|uniref:Uncharacterized protein n=1 Tax=Sclerotinia sclerotiorum (strain ATCC 18683 / 1980 / Ss-1) TaxID=665079 RepID=A7ECW7_SCLS1|nr:predicted protein [Sclerotinia sclerotiorum 1980 UF-70]EDO00683.1 predicted protein [Sclerotinia sclerotiorum 1980 UF-70]